MAKGNMLQGQATGKVGDIVFMVRNGQQVARVYTSAGGRSGDQASIAVRRQRVRFGAASNQYLLYRNIVRGMYRTGKSTKQSDYNFFVRENVDLLPYLTKEENAAAVKCAMPGNFSRGTLGNIIHQWKYEEPAGGSPSGAVLVSGMAYDDDVLWSATVADLKTVLKDLYPNARKINYCVLHVIKNEVLLPSGSQWSHTFERGDVVFDLFQEDMNVGDDQPISSYFQYYAPQSLAINTFGQATGAILSNNKLFSLQGDEMFDKDLLQEMLVLIFATNDQVGDCYTSTLSEIITPDTDGGLSLYADLRTDDHRQIAEDSYGYATGVMRTNIQQS